jgi:superfamily II DNA helicase RecQ
VAFDLRAPRDDERAVMERILDLLRRNNRRPTGRLHRDLGGSPARPVFERLLTALARAGLVQVVDDSFDKDGDLVRFRRALLTPEGRAARDLGEVRVAREPGAASAKPPRAGRRVSRAARGAAPVLDLDGDAPSAPEALVTALKEWRRAEARERAIPAYCVLKDRAIVAVAATRPRDIDALLGVHGIGPVVVREYGRAILGIVERWRAGHGGGEPG